MVFSLSAPADATSMPRHVMRAPGADHPGLKSPSPACLGDSGEGSSVVVQSSLVVSRRHCAVGGKGQSEHVLSAQLMTAAGRPLSPGRLAGCFQPAQLP